MGKRLSFFCIFTPAYYSLNILMITLLSPAKTIKIAPKSPAQIEASIAPFIDESGPVATAVSRLTSVEMAKLLRLSPKLAQESFLTWQKYFDADALTAPALLAYSGIVFKQMAASKMSASEWDYAQEHLLICSFLYGLLRPKDAIKAYRLEGNTPLGEPLAKTPFAYWPDILTPWILQYVQQRGGVLCMLASEEMKSLFHWEQLERSVRVVSPSFYVRQADASLKQIVVYTKMARGLMAKSILSSRIEQPEQLIDLAPLGFRFDASRSTDSDYVYIMEGE